MPPERSERPPTRVVITSDGPVLVDGPVEVVTPDGRRAVSERPVTAVCVCGNSRRYPFCDTSHRRRVRGADTPPAVPREDQP